LADQLRQSFNLEPGDGEQLGPLQPAPSAEGEETLANADLAWLDYSSPAEPADLRQVLLSAADLIRPLAKRYGVRLEVSSSSETSPLALHPVVLRQILLSLFSVAVRRSRGGSVEVSIQQKGGEAGVQVCSRSLGLSASGDDESDPSLVIARRLIDRCKGSLTLHAEGNERVMTLTFPALEWLPVLVIDDNITFRHLLQRYAAHTRYRVLGAANFQEAMDLISRIPPRVIILDVMMPETDGWELLGRLRQHPATSHIPVVVCTILAEEDLAYSLGARGFIRKPVTRQMFLNALDDQVGQAEPRSR
jgi:CheY-like chemotaxis protein